MALQDVTNKERGSLWTTSVTLESRFGPLVKKGVRIDQQVSKSKFPSFGAAGINNIDLWLDGSLYIFINMNGLKMAIFCLFSKFLYSWSVGQSL